MITLSHNGATVTVSPYGGQVMSYVKNGRDLLWQTEEHFLTKAQTENRALRGGIPVCWPWFNKWNDNADAPSHGFARTSKWKIEKQTPTTAILTLTTDATHPFFPHKAKAELKVTLTDTLHVALTTKNTGATTFVLTQALHSYFRIEDIATTRVQGFANHPHEGIAPEPFPNNFKITSEIDTIFQNVDAPTHLRQPDATTSVTNTGTTEAVLWNPWSEKAKTLDMPPESYQHFICIEAATIKTAPLLKPGQSHTLTTQIAGK